MKRILTFIFAAMSWCFPMVALQITTQKAGTLAQELDKHDRNEYRHQTLVISGPMNAGDFPALRDLCYDVELHSIDLSNAEIEYRKIPEYAFNNPLYDISDIKSNLTEIIIPEDILKIGERAFYNVPLQHINFPQYLQEIEDEAFAKTSLRTVSLPDKCHHLGKGVFYETPLKEIKLPEGLHNIPYRFAAKTSITQLTVPSNISFIGDEAFSCCYWLSSLSLSEGIEEIGRSAFYDCICLASIDLPASLYMLDLECFVISDWHPDYIISRSPTPPICEILYTGKYNRTTPFMDDNANMPTVDPDTPVYVPVGSAELYRNAPGWDYFTTYIETDDFQSAGTDEIRPGDRQETSITVDNGSIVINHGVNDGTYSPQTEYTVYTMDGRTVVKGKPEGSQTRLELPTGMYIVSAGKNTAKVIL